MTLTLRNVQLDVPGERFDEAVAFWAAAVGATDVRARDSGRFRHLVGLRSLVGIHLQRLDEGVAGVHLDLDADDVDAEVQRLVELGATPVEDGPCRVLLDPAGLPFCVCAGAGPSEELRVADAEGGRLHVLVIDVASAHVEATAGFWGEALGVEAEHLPAPYDAYWRLEGVPVPGGPMRVLVQDIGPDATPRVHLDLHVVDRDARDAEVARLGAAGAEVNAEGEFPWTVLRDPAGLVLCVVPDA